MKTPRQGPDGGGASGRNIKRRTGAPVANGSSGADGGRFVSAQKKSNFETSYRHRKIINGSRAVFSGPEGSHIAGNIEAMGWTPMITMDLPVYPRLVRLFYCNLEYNLAETSITSLVNGTPIRLDCASLAAILGIPNEGIEHYPGAAADSPRGPNPRCLPALSQRLFDMLVSIFVPRRHHGRPSEMDMFLLDQIQVRRRQRVNLCYIIIRHMMESIGGLGNSDLPYGMLLTKVFNAFDVVIGPEEEFEKMNRVDRCDFFRGGSVLTNAGWTLGSLPQEEETRDMEEHQKEEEAGDEEPPETDSTQESLSKLNGREDLRCQPEQGFAILDEPLSKLTARVDSVDNKLSALVESVASLVQDGRCQREEGLANLNESLGKLTARVDSLDGKLTALVERVDNKLSALVESVASLVQHGRCQQEGLGNLNDSLGTVTARVDSLDGKLTAQVDSVDNKLSALVESVASLVRDGRCQREGLGNLNDSLGVVTARVDSLDAKLTARVDSVTSSFQDRQCQQEQGLTNLNESLGKVTTQVDSVGSSVKDLQCQQEQVFTNLNESLSKVAARVDSVDDSKLNARVDIVASSVQDLRCQQGQVFTKLNQSLSQVAARVDSVDSKLAARVDSVDSMLTARADTVASSVQGLRCEQEKRFADLNTKLDSLIGYLNYHFCPYPPPPTPFNGKGAWKLLNHGAYPEADIPICQVSVQAKQDSTYHYNMGKALRPLREEGVLIFGSGSDTHKLRDLRFGSDDAIVPWAEKFNTWLNQSLLEGRYDDVNHYEKKAPHAKKAHPWPDHFFYPLHVAMGAAAEDSKAELIHESWSLGTFSYASYWFKSTSASVSG